MGYLIEEWGLPVPYHTEHRPRRGGLGFVALVVGGIKLGFVLGCEVSRALSALTTDRGPRRAFGRAGHTPPRVQPAGSHSHSLLRCQGGLAGAARDSVLGAVPLHRRGPRNQKMKKCE